MNPYLTIEGLAGISYFLGCFLFVLFQTDRLRSFQAIHFTLVAMGLVYGGLFPLVVHNAANVDFMGASFLVVSQDFMLAHTWAAFIAAISVYFGWQAVPRTSVARLGTFFKKASTRSIIFWLYAMTATAFVTQYLYTIDYGGFIGYFEYNRLVRSGLFHLFERSSFSFLNPFGGFVVFACYGFWGLLLSGKRGPVVLFGFLISLAFSTYVLMAGAGRVSMLIFLAVLLMSFLFVRRTHYLAWLLLIPIMSPAAIFGLFLISDLLSLKAADDVSYFLVKESSFPFAGFFAQLNEGDHFGLFKDVLLSPAYLVPSSMTSSWLSTASDLNTEIIMGARKGEYGVTGSIPTDMLTFGLMQFHFLGIAIYAFIFGYFLKAVSALAGSFRMRGLSAAFTAYIVIKIAIFGIFYAYPQHIIMGSFPAVVVILSVIGYRIMRRFLRVASHNS